MSREALNMTTDELDNLARLGSARREIGDIADALSFKKTSKKEDRQDMSRRLNAVKASLKTVELRLGGEL